MIKKLIIAAFSILTIFLAVQGYNLWTYCQSRHELSPLFLETLANDQKNGRPQEIMYLLFKSAHERELKHLKEADVLTGQLLLKLSQLQHLNEKERNYLQNHFALGATKNVQSDQELLHRFQASVLSELGTSEVAVNTLNPQARKHLETALTLFRTDGDQNLTYFRTLVALTSIYLANGEIQSAEKLLSEAKHLSVMRDANPQDLKMLQANQEAIQKLK